MRYTLPTDAQLGNINLCIENYEQVTIPDTTVALSE